MGVFGFQCYRETFLGYRQGWFRGFQYFEFIQIRTSWCRGIGRYFYGIRPGSQVNQHLGRFGGGSIPFRRSVNGTFYLWIIIYFYSESAYTVAVEISFEFIGSGFFHRHIVVTTPVVSSHVFPVGETVTRFNSRRWINGVGVFGF